MRKFKLLILGILISAGAFAGEKEDIKFLDELFKQQKYSIALQEANMFVKKYPHSKYIKNIKIKIGQVYYIEKNYQKSIDSLNNCLKELNLDREELNTVYLYIAKSYISLNDFNSASRAINLIDKSKKDGKDKYSKALIALGQEYMNNKKYIMAQKNFKKALSFENNNYEEAVLNLALAAYNNSQYIKTIVYLDEYYKEKNDTPNMGLVNYLYGTSYYKMNEIKNAVTYLKKVQKSKVQSEYKALSNLTLIEIYLKNGDSKSAKLILDSLANQGKIYDKALKSFGDFYSTRGSDKIALDYYNKINKKNVDVVYGIALSEYKLKNYKTSLINFEKLKNTKFEKESIYYRLSIEYLNGNYSWILKNKNLIKGLKLNREEQLSVNDIIANSAFEKKQYDVAEKYFEKNYKTEPSKKTLYRLIVTVSKTKNTQKTDDLIKKYKTIYPTDQEYKKNLTILSADTLVNEKKSKEAIDIYQKYLENDRDDEILINLIGLMIEERQYSEVMDYLNLQDSSNENTYYKGIAMMGMGEYAKAEMYFNQLLNKDKNIDKILIEKTKYNKIKNNFLWEKYEDVITDGELYIKSEYLYKLEDVVDKVAISCFRLDKYDVARQYFEKLKLISNMSDYAQFQIAESYFSEKNYLEAIKSYQKTIDTSQNVEYQEKALYWILSSLYLMKNSDEFNINSDKFIKLYPDSKLKDNIILMKGQLYEIKGDAKESIKTYETLYNNTKDKFIKEGAVLKLIQISHYTKNIQQELSWINKITNNNKKTYYMAKYLEENGKIEEAKLEFDKLFLSKDYKDFASLKLGDYYYLKKDYKQSADYYTKVLNFENSIYKDNALYQLANIDKIMGNIKESITKYTKLYILYPGSKYALEAKTRVAENYEELKEYEQAVTQYDELLKTESKNKEYYLEKLIVLNLKLKNVENAKIYYLKLKNENEKLANKYTNYFEGGSNI